jgi:N-methylhydantoinase B/oxoprolinase/acetone carboxylase alpha subunit
LINPGDPDEKRLPGRYADYPLKRGDVFRLATPGGGGYGDPLAREPDRVLADIREGYVSRAAAERDYGIVLVETAGGLRIDRDATARRRAIERAAGGPNKPCRQN